MSDPPRSWAVVGAGPAGLSAAITAAVTTIIIGGGIGAWSG